MKRRELSGLRDGGDLPHHPDAADQIIKRKGSTYYGVASGLVRIVGALVRDQHTVLFVSSPLTGQSGLSNLCLSLPTAVARWGIDRMLEIELGLPELEKLRKSAEILASNITALALPRSV